MKRFTLLNIFLFTFFMIIFVGFRTEGFYSAIFMRQDLPHYLVLVPFYLGVTVFIVVYQALSINWKDLKNNWQNILAILVSILLCICLIFQTSFYMMLTTTFQNWIISIFAVLIFITTAVNYWNYKKPLKTEKSNKIKTK